MAVVRPWVTPDEVRAYSDAEEVINRQDSQLEVDIARAEQYVITYTNNDFRNHKELPLPVRTAVIILSEAYAHNASVVFDDLKSESFDDYSYTTEGRRVDADSLNLGSLLDEFVIAKASGNVTMRMRRL